MWNMIWPLLLIVLSNCFYNICTKSVPEGANTFGTLTVTYLVGAVALLIIGYLLFKETITVKQLAGVVVCGVGLFLINEK